jgi:hypothetical protein
LIQSVAQEKKRKEEEDDEEEGGRGKEREEEEEETGGEEERRRRRRRILVKCGKKLKEHFIMHLEMPLYLKFKIENIIIFIFSILFPPIYSLQKLHCLASRLFYIKYFYFTLVLKVTFSWHRIPCC